MIDLTFIAAAAAILFAAVLLIAGPLLRDPRRRKRRALDRARSAGILNDAEYRRQLAAAPADTRRPLLAITIGVLLPLAAVALYGAIGRPEALAPEAARTVHNPQPGEATPGDISQAVQSLRDRLAAVPDDAAGWALLGRTLKTLGQYDEALDALQTARRIAPDDPGLQVETVEAMLFAGGQPELPPVARELLAQALAADPENQKGLWLAGLDAAQRAEYATAIEHWQRLRARLTDGSEVAAALDAQIAQARAAQNDDTPLAATAPAVERPPETGRPTVLRLRIALDPALASAAPDGGVLFVFARPPEGGPPYAGKRVAPGPFPLDVTLSDEDAMLPGRNLSSAATFKIGARWSASGEALPQAGDLEGYGPVLATGAGAETIELTIDHRYPSGE